MKLRRIKDLLDAQPRMYILVATNFHSFTQSKRRGVSPVELFPLDRDTFDIFTAHMSLDTEVNVKISDQGNLILGV